MKIPRRIIFIQLPLLNHSYDYIMGNVEYASAAISGYIKKHISADIEIYILPMVLTQFGSDSMILRYILALEPDVVAFTCYLWNIERHLKIARTVKEYNSRIQVIMGGSEIHPGSLSLQDHRPSVDYFVTGEGEWFFNMLASGSDVSKYAHKINNNTVIIQPGGGLIKAELIVEPFTGKRLNNMPDGSQFFELMRGCPYRCSYCFYSKNFGAIREVPFDLLVRALTDKGLTRGLNELYILAPALNATKDFKSRLERLAGIGHGIRLHSEMRAQGIDAETARLIYRAGFRSMEIGLQTLHDPSLKRVGRKSDTGKELDGMLHLKNAGLDLKIGLIPGLPGDTREKFYQTIDRLIQLGFRENLELYPLMILPGTMIHDQADAEGVHYLKKPPYYYHDGWGMSFDDIRDITRYMEEQTGLSHIVSKLPDFTKGITGLFNGAVYIKGKDPENWNSGKYQQIIETNVFSFFIIISDLDEIYRGLPSLLHSLESTELVDIVFYTNGIIQEHRITSLLQEIEKDNLFRRLHIFHEWKDGLSVRMFQVIDRLPAYHAAMEEYCIITPIFRVTPDNWRDLKQINNYEDNVLIAQGSFGIVQNILKKFTDSPESVAFEEYEDHRGFYRMIGQEFMELPFRFRGARL